ncbi:MAG: hypothetical protein DMG26_19320 [Acidobacteria bacterium]|nr:MAG: hypothetical protein DMG26_19320 [Acidobacteriota bacterium]
MNRSLRAAVIGSVMLWLAALGLAAEKKPKSGPLTGTWECVSHGGPHGDMNFTLYLEQNQETVTGTVSSPLGSTELTSASFKKNTLEIHIDTDERNYASSPAPGPRTRTRRERGKARNPPRRPASPDALAPKPPTNLAGSRTKS